MSDRKETCVMCKHYHDEDITDTMVKENAK